MKRLLLLLFLTLSLSAAAQTTETWSGVLNVQGTRLRLVFHLTQTVDGWQATMDSPDQGAKGIPMDEVAVAPFEVKISSQQLGMSYHGARLGQEQLMGVFRQSGNEFPLLLKRGEAERPNRPQEPRKPYPYREVEVTFASRDALTLVGTLTLPEGEERHPAIVLVTGSGTQNRDEELMEHRPFWVLADRLTRAGFVVLRYDDRGYKATPEEAQRLVYSTTDHLTLDALGAFDFLRNHAAVDADRIVVAGHSEGGTIAVMAAAQEPQVAAVVSLAGMMMRGDALLVKQNVVGLQMRGLPEAIAEGYGRALGRLYGRWRELTPEEAMAQKEQLVREAVANEQLPQPLVDNLQRVAEMAANPWLYRFVGLEPMAAVAQLNGRKLWAANGTKDIQVDAEENLRLLEALEQEHITTRRFEGLNHLFQPCTTGAVEEYGQIETTLSEEVITELVAWLKAHL
ncbi:MAG: alpha/beta fold hydrolase [Alistipes sp.]|nr:alpha/beta fold hydrolase [Alistipes sp.]